MFVKTVSVIKFNILHIPGVAITDMVIRECALASIKTHNVTLIEMEKNKL